MLKTKNFNEYIHNILFKDYDEELLEEYKKRSYRWNYLLLNIKKWYNYFIIWR